MVLRSILILTVIGILWVSGCTAPIFVYKISNDGANSEDYAYVDTLQQIRWSYFGNANFQPGIVYSSFTIEICNNGHNRVQLNLDSTRLSSSHFNYEFIGAKILPFDSRVIESVELPYGDTIKVLFIFSAPLPMKDDGYDYDFPEKQVLDFTAGQLVVGADTIETKVIHFYYD